MKSKAKNVKAVLEWRRRAKKRLIEAFGGKCGICGYNKCDRNLGFHHIDPTTKEFGFGNLQSKAWNKIVAEIKKCVMLCHNCHGEVHEGITKADQCPPFNQDMIEYRGSINIPASSCIVCGNPNHSGKKYCSVSCRNIGQQKQHPSAEELGRLIKTHTLARAGALYEVSGTTFKKWAINYGYNTKVFDKRKNGGSGGV